MRNWLGYFKVAGWSQKGKALINTGHLIRFHGVLAPNAKLRSEIIPSPPEPATEPSNRSRSHARLAGALELGQAAQTGLRYRHRTLPELRGQLKDYRRPFDRLRTGIEDPPVIVRILTHVGFPSRAPALRFDLFQTV